MDSVQIQIQDFPESGGVGCHGYGYFILGHFIMGHIMWYTDKTLVDKMLEDKMLAIFWGQGEQSADLIKTLNILY